MTDEERLWWNILVEAEMLSESASRHDGALALRYFQVSVKARTTLRDKFGINLDDLGVKAREQVMVLEEELAVKEREEKLRMQEFLKAVERAEELLKNGKTS
jgi:hypothetical protein